MLAAHMCILANKKFSSRVNVKLPTVEVRYKNLFVEAECEVVQGKPLPTLWNSLLSLLSVSICFELTLSGDILFF